MALTVPAKSIPTLHAAAPLFHTLTTLRVNQRGPWSYPTRTMMASCGNNDAFSSGFSPSRFLDVVLHMRSQGLFGSGQLSLVNESVRPRQWRCLDQAVHPGLA